jgi:hypothetical protein
MNVLKKVLAIGMIAAVIGSASAVPTFTTEVSAAAAVTISNEVKNTNYYVKFVEPYAADKQYKTQSTDNKFTSVTLSSFQSFDLYVYNTKKFKTTDKISIKRAASATGKYIEVASAKPKAATSQKLTIEHDPGKTKYYSIEVIDSTGKVQYAQRFKVTVSANEISNDKIKAAIRQTTVAGNTDSYESKTLSTKADNKAAKIQLIDTKNFYIDYSNIPDNYYLVGTYKSVKKRNNSVSTQTIGKRTASEGKITYSDYFWEDNGLDFVLKICDPTGNVVQCSEYLVVSKPNKTEVRSELYLNTDGTQNGYVSLYTEDGTFADNVSYKSMDVGNQSTVVRSQYLPLIVTKSGGAYDDSEDVKVYVKESKASDFGSPVTTFKEATTENCYRAIVKLPKLNVGYDIKTEIKTITGNTIVQSFNNVYATSYASAGIRENYSEVNANGKLISRTNNTYVKSGDTIKERYAIDIPVYTGKTSKYSVYSLKTKGIGSTEGKVQIFVKQNDKEKLVYTAANNRDMESINLSELGITPKAKTSADIIVRMFNASGKKTGEWTRTINFVYPTLFNFRFSLSAGSYNIYNSETNNIDSTIKDKTVNHKITDGIVFSNTSFDFSVGYNSSLTGLPANVSGTLMIKKAGEKTSKTLFKLDEFLNMTRSSSKLPYIISKGNYALEDGETYVLTFKFYNNTTKQTFHTETVTFKYAGLEG